MLPGFFYFRQFCIYANGFPMTKTPYLLVAFAAALLSIGYLIYLNNSQQVKLQTLASDKANLQHQLDTLQPKVDSLAKMMQRKDSLLSNCRDRANILLRDWAIDKMKRQGLGNPVQELKQDLVQSKELIQEKGVLGGQMQFYSKENIFILNHEWALAYYEDGHNAGAMLLAYEVEPGGIIDWRVIESSNK